MGRYQAYIKRVELDILSKWEWAVFGGTVVFDLGFAPSRKSAARRANAAMRYLCKRDRKCGLDSYVWQKVGESDCKEEE